MEHSYKVIAFDLDGTLTESKSPVAPHMATLFNELLDRYLVVVASGGALPQFIKQFVAHLGYNPERLGHLTLIPNSGGSMYKYDAGKKEEGDEKWVSVFSHELSIGEKEEIKKAIDDVLPKMTFELPSEHYGERLEDRGSEMTFSALGQAAPLSAKEAWDADMHKRRELAAALQKKLGGFEVRVGGSTSIDITRKGTSKAVALDIYMKAHKIKPEELLYVGDALYVGGNDSSVMSLPIKTARVSGPEETEKLIAGLLKKK